MTPTNDLPADSSPSPAPRLPWLRRRLGFLTVLAALLVFVLLGWRTHRQARERDEALRLCREGRIAEVEPLLIRALERREDDLELIQEMSRGYFAAHKNEAADFYLRRWRTLQPDAQEPRDKLMDLLVRRVKVEMLLEHREPVAEDRRVVACQRELLSLQVAGLYTEMEQRCRQFLEHWPASPTLHCLLAEACHQRGQNDEARTLVEQLLQEEPQHKDALLLRAILYGEVNQPSQALPLLRQVLAQDRLHTTARYYLSQALAQTGQMTAAEQEMAEMLRHKAAEHAVQDILIQPNNVALQIHAAEALLHCGRSDEAVSLLRAVLERSPGSTAARQLLAAQNASKGQPAPAAP
jgi:predicted Zn-dependent protease